jgi:hypothetical protein
MTETPHELTDQTVVTRLCDACLAPCSAQCINHFGIWVMALPPIKVDTARPRGMNVDMMCWEIIARLRVQELLQEAQYEQLLHEAAEPPVRNGSRWSTLVRRLTAARVTIDDPLADTPAWPRLTGYPCGPRPRG